MSTEDLGIEITDRGFRRMRPVKGDYGAETARVYESSDAMAPHVWLHVSGRLNDGSGKDSTIAVHLPLVEAELLGRQLAYLAREHYQVSDFGVGGDR
ncbi:hypothetical protein [Amycolatopsis sp. CA-230715]|uniref:hypothetical protein n=1 Tax=Amycolatopsis sp. CA-230715 TaxID=2745196 RepID=UPI001C0220CE|nr:hypothetical protein [Amycolatopsis sp. CA-230715]QWF85761.1 hypothetical protein HUW46_09241 [Amycolatopsis sp. CA-230715]